MKVLFVCSGNICRSPFAERSLRREAAARGLAVTTRSAGTWAIPGNAPPRLVVEIASEFGIDLSDHRARLLEVALVAESDLLVGMEEDHLDELRKAVRASDSRGRILALGSLDSGPADVPDPWGEEPDEIRRVLRRIEVCVAKLLATASS